jgi:hypothetical protein
MVGNYFAQKRLYRLLFCAALLIFPVRGFLWPQAGLGIHPGADFAALSRKGAVIIDFDTTKRAEVNWVDFSVDMHGVSPYSLNELREVLRDYQNYPRYFKRCVDIQVRDTAAGSALDLALGLKVLGGNSALVFLCLASEPVNTEDVFDAIFSQRDDFTQLDNAVGEWYFRRVKINEKPWTYYRFYGKGSVILKHPLQELFMKVFGQGEFRDVVNQLFRAAARRNKMR